MITKGQKYRHFKGKEMQVLDIVKNTETLSDMVVYVDMDNTDIHWCRPIEMFTEKVDKVKYPEITQEYRFELIEE